MTLLCAPSLPAYVCVRVLCRFVDDVSKQSRSFHRGFDSGFPSLCDNLIQAALNSYDAATKDYSPTAARLKNRQAFIKLMLNGTHTHTDTQTESGRGGIRHHTHPSLCPPGSDLVEKYEAQLRALMGLTVDRFRQGLSKTRIGPGLVRALEGAQRDALAFFTSNAHRLKPRSAGNAWSEAAQRSAHLISPTPPMMGVAALWLIMCCVGVLCCVVVSGMICSRF